MSELPRRTRAAAAHHDAAAHERERHAVFARSWQLVATSQQLAEAGQHLGTDLVGWPLVVVRTDDGALRAFHNVCPHRAGPLVDDGPGRGSRFVCRYHGWSFDHEGALLRARDFRDPNLDEGAHCLRAVPVGEWRGLVFVHLHPEAPDLHEWLAPLAALAEGFPMEELQHSHDVQHDLEADWKTYADNYLEGYHLPLVHPELTREVVADEYEVVVGDHVAEHLVPPRDGAINAGRWLWRHPNLALNLYPDAMNVEHYLPLGPGRCRVTYRYFFRDRDRPDPEVERISKLILEEDRLICEAVQRNLEAGVYERGPLSPVHERAVAAFTDWLDEDLRRG